MKLYLRSLALGVATLAVTLAVAFVGASKMLNEPAPTVATILRYIAISASIALALGLLGVGIGMRFLPRLSLKVAVGYGIGSVGAIITVAYTPLLMFKDPGDLHLLILLLACFMVISLGLGTTIALGVAHHLEALRTAARHVAEGRFDTRVEVPSGDEVSDLAEAFNRMSAELGIAFEREQAVEQGRRNLVAAISHDLRTPLASIRAMLEAIHDGVVQDQPTIQRYHAAMHDQVERLSRLIDDLLELSRLDSGAHRLRLEDVNFSELVLETVESLRPAAERRGVQLAVNTDSVIPRATVDADQLQRVVANLVQNAIRHTPSGGSVETRVGVVGQELVVEVADSGEGVSSSDVDHVFDRFYRGEKARTRTASAGAGLGLAIAKAIVEAHRGRIWVDTERSTGARFVFTVPAG